MYLLKKGVDVILVYVRVAQEMYKITSLQPADLRHHACQQ